MRRTTNRKKAILCIDPGTTHSGVVVYDGEKVLYSNAEMENYTVLDFILNGEISVGRKQTYQYECLVVEMIQNYAKVVGEAVFETVLWTGRFIQVANSANIPCQKIFRKDVKLFLCGTARAGNANVRQAIIDMFPKVGGGKTPSIGTKKQPGPLYDMKSHAFSALALGLLYYDRLRDEY